MKKKCLICEKTIKSGKSLLCNKCTKEIKDNRRKKYEKRKEV